MSRLVTARRSAAVARPVDARARRRCPAAATRGFTLIEVLVVVLLLGIATSIVLPRLSATGSSRTTMMRAANRIAGAAILASERAALRRTVQVLTIDLAAGTYSIRPRQLTGGIAPSAEAATGGSLPEGIDVLSIAKRWSSVTATSGTVELQFAPDGWAEAATIELGATSGARATVTLHDLGGFVETDLYDDVPGGPR